MYKKFPLIFGTHTKKKKKKKIDFYLDNRFFVNRLSEKPKRSN